MTICRALLVMIPANSWFALLVGTKRMHATFGTAVRVGNALVSVTPSIRRHAFLCGTPHMFTPVTYTFLSATADFVVFFWTSAAPEAAHRTSATVRVLVAPSTSVARCRTKVLSWAPIVTLSLLKHTYGAISLLVRTVPAGIRLHPRTRRLLERALLATDSTARLTTGR